MAGRRSCPFFKTGTLRKIAGLKYFNVYGPGEDHKGEMRSLVNKAYPQVACKGKMRLFRSYHPDDRNGEQQRDFIHVSDAVAVTLFFGDHPTLPGLFNCGTGEASAWKDLAAVLFAALGKPMEIEWIDIPVDIRKGYQYYTRADISKLRRMGYDSPFLSIEEGVRRCIDEYLACF